MADRRPSPFQGYVATVVAGGLLAVVVILARGAPDFSFLSESSFWMLSVLTFAAEARPLRVPMGDHEGELTISTIFGLALLLLLGPVAALVGLGGAVVAADVLRRKRASKIAFNAAQYAIAIGLSAAVVSASQTWYAGSGAAPAWLLLVALVAGVVFAASNFLLMAGVLTAAGRSDALGPVSRSFVRIVSDDLAFTSWSYAILITLAPVVAIVARFSVWAVPLFAVPTVGVYQSVGIYLDRARHALHDRLTGLPNRELFEDRVRQAVLRARHRQGDIVAVLILNLDAFKEINSQLGYEAGDDILRRISGRLEAHLREIDTLARLAADEFGIVLAGVSGRADADSTVRALREAVARPFAMPGGMIAIEASVGGALTSSHGTDARELIAAADRAMADAKRLRLGHDWYRPQESHTSGRMRLLADLRAAIDNGELELHYQTKTSLPTGPVAGLEALVRWRRADGELVPPGAFLPVAEDTGLIGDLTRYVIEQAVWQMRRWQDRGHPIGVAVNISARDLHDPGLAEHIAATLHRHGVPPGMLELEVTESSIMVDVDTAVDTLTRLERVGVRLAIDDFGTGNTSLSQLPRLPVHVLKIDRSFVEGLGDGRRPADAPTIAGLSDGVRGDAARTAAATGRVPSPEDLIVRTTVDLGRGMGLEVVAEGVSSAVIRDRVTDLGCDFAQGYFFSRPLPAEAVEQLLTGLRAER